MHSTNLYKRGVFSLLVFYTAFFPYLSFGTNNMDTQPWFLLACIGYLVFEKGRVNLFACIFVVFCLLLLFGFSIADASKGGVYASPLFLLIRAGFSYVTFFVGISVFFSIHRSGFLPKKIHFYLISIAYIGVGLLQSQGLSFLDFLSPNRTTVGRGVTSLASEPTYFALIFLFFNLYKVLYARSIFGEKELRWYILIESLLVFILCKSTMVFFLVILMALNAVLVNRKVMLYSAIILIPLLVWLFGFSELLMGSRVYKLVWLLLERPESFVMLDESVNSRAQDLIFPYIGLFYNFFLPGGILSYGAFSEYARQASEGVFYYGGSDKIMSFIGVLVYELGVVGLLLVYGLVFRFLKASGLGFIYLPFYLLLFHMAIPIGAGYAIALLAVTREMTGRKAAM